jgi:phosphoglycerate dehydrogenase-like enzyme
MDAALKIVTRLPLRELWRDDGFRTTARLRSLAEEDILSLLRSGTIQFVVVDVGTPPRWIQQSECFQFWKIEAQPHLASNSQIVLEEFPDQYCYVASQGEEEDQAAPIVAPEMQH